MSDRLLVHVQIGVPGQPQALIEWSDTVDKEDLDIVNDSDNGHITRQIKYRIRKRQTPLPVSKKP